jgi:hypothetical protein
MPDKRSFSELLALFDDEFQMVFQVFSRGYQHIGERKRSTFGMNTGALPIGVGQFPQHPAQLAAC